MAETDKSIIDITSMTPLEKPGKKDVEPDDDTKLVEHLMNLFDEYKDSDYRKKYLENDDSEVKLAQKKYRQDRDAKTFPWPNCSNKQMPLSAIAVDHLEPRLAGMLASDSDFVSVKPVGEEDIINVANVVKDIHWLLKNVADWKKTVFETIHDLLINGTIFLLPVQEEQKKKRRQRIIPTPEMVAEILSQKLSPEMMEIIPLMISDPQFPDNLPPEILEQIPDFEDKESNDYKLPIINLDLNDVYAPSKCDKFEDVPTIRRFSLTKDELKAKSKKNGGPYIVTDSVLRAFEEEKVIDRKTITQEHLDTEGSAYKEELDCLECYIKWDLKDDAGYDWVLVTIAKPIEKIIRKQRLIEVYFDNEKPIKRIRLWPESKALYGHGIPFIIRHIETGCTDLFNQMIDSGTVQIDPWFFYEPASGYDADQVSLAPGKGVPVVDASKIHFPNLTVSAVAYLQFINFLLAMFERLTSLADYGMGRESESTSKGGGTLGGIQLIMQQGEIQHGYRGSRIQAEYAEVIKSLYLLYIQTVPIKLQKRVFEQNQWAFEQTDIQGLLGNYDFEITLSPNEANVYYKQRKEMEFGQAATPSMQFLNPMKITEDLLKAWDKKPIEEYLNPELIQAIQQFFQQKQQEQQTQEMQEKEQSSQQRRGIHLQTDMESPVRVEELRKKVIEGQVREGIKQEMVGMGGQGGGPGV